MPRELWSGYRVGKPDGGPECEALERELEDYYQVPYARVFNSATSALHAACVVTGNSPVDVSPLSMSASAACVLHANRHPVFTDLRDDYSMDCQEWVAVMPHLFGHHVKRPLAPFSVIHDCAQAPSVKPDVTRPNDIYVYSLNQWKVASCGEGGYALTFVKAIADRLHAVRNHGECYTDDILGYNFRMTEMQAAIARREFRQLDSRLATRREWAAMMRTKYDLPDDPGNIDWFLYPVRVKKNREEFAARIPGARVGYHRVLYRLPYFAKRYPNVSCPNAEKIEAELVVIDPMFYGL